MALRLFLLLILPVIALASTFERLESKLLGIKSVKVVFVQKVKYSWYPKPEVSKGIFYATKGGKFRIEYTQPDPVIIVSDGKEIIIYNEEERSALIDSTQNNTSPVVESLFFFSRPLSEVFEPIGELVKGDYKVLILKPKRKDENIKEVYVDLDEGMEVKRVRVIDSEDTETIIEFVSVRKNYTPSSHLFRIDLPPDVRVRRVGK